jgi:hypothetical protein
VFDLTVDLHDFVVVFVEPGHDRQDFVGVRLFDFDLLPKLFCFIHSFQDDFFQFVGDFLRVEILDTEFVRVIFSCFQRYIFLLNNLRF